MSPAQKLIGYIRVSTKRQGESGLGLEAQIKAIADYASSVAGCVLASYREIETGTDDRRPQIEKAIAHVKKIKGRLVIAKLDRLARDVHFVSGLTKAEIDFVACDMPHASLLQIHIMASVAQEEARAISERTKAALAAAKARGTLLGSARPGHWDGREDVRQAAAAKARQRAHVKHLAAAQAAYGDVWPIMRQMRDDGATLREIAANLNEAGHMTLRGFVWNPMQVSRCLNAET